MKLRKPIIPLLSLCLSLLLLASCGGKKQSEAAQRHEQWLMSLNDSIDKLRQRLQIINDSITLLHSQVDEQLAQFERMDNARWVEGFTIYKGWSGRYPLTSTGIVARITEDESLELVAALSNATFESIRIDAGSQSATSQRVPHDQALNYRAGSLNTVAFSGPKADSVAMVVAMNPDADAIVTFFGNQKSGIHKLTAAEKEMIAATWRLSDTHKRANRLERELPLINEKIKIYQLKATPRDSVRQ